MSLLDLPYTVFAQIISYIPPVDAIRCRRVSRDSLAALSRPELAISLLLQHFPRSREGQELRGLITSKDAFSRLDSTDWARVFACVVRRYHNLRHAKPRRVASVDMDPESVDFAGVKPWDKLLQLDRNTAPFHYTDPRWAMSAKDGLLVYPRKAGFGAMDLETGNVVPVPFGCEGKIVRRVRISCDVLVIEWTTEADQRASLQHYATAFDVAKVLPEDEALGNGASTLWKFALRCEWQTCEAGLVDDRFFSAHDATHYVSYCWHEWPTPGDEASEQLTVWEMGSTPRVVLSLDEKLLAHYGVLQRDTPSLRSVQLAAGHVFLWEEEHRWSVGPHRMATLPRLHTVKSTGIPLVGCGPHTVDVCGAEGGRVKNLFGFCRRFSTEQQQAADQSPSPMAAPCWRHDDFPYLTVCEANDASAGVRFTARHCFMMETVSVHVRPRLRIHGVSKDVESKRKKNVSARSSASSSQKKEEVDEGQDREVQFEDAMWEQLMGCGFMAGDERWLVGQKGEDTLTILYF